MGRIRTRNSFMYCRAKILATNLLSAHPVAMPRIPPSGFVRAVSLALINALVTSAGTLARARLVTASKRSSTVSLSSRRSFRCS